MIQEDQTENQTTESGQMTKNSHLSEIIRENKMKPFPPHNINDTTNQDQHRTMALSCTINITMDKIHQTELDGMGILSHRNLYCMRLLSFI